MQSPMANASKEINGSVGYKGFVRHSRRGRKDPKAQGGWHSARFERRVFAVLAEIPMAYLEHAEDKDLGDVGSGERCRVGASD